MTVPALVVSALWALLAAVLAAGVPATKRLPATLGSPPAGEVHERQLSDDEGPAVASQTHRLRPGYAVALGLVLLLLQPELAPVPLAVALASSLLAHRKRARLHEAAVVDQLPDLVDLLRLTTLAGFPVSTALRAIGGRAGGVVGTAVSRSVQLLERGATTAQALDALAQALGGAARGLIDVLADHDRYGTPLGPGLDRVGIECRLQRRRRAEEAARRLPVTLLFPLVMTTLPAFVLLTILPLVVASFASLQL